ncbi:hypothetical protein HG536_0D00900 [Torulaspora globosa]|uniref:Uncharacterized protein n=1 Tax=Torulaspora globosa TaxID=48254 RepID=A0A7G3ZGD2_9SACH|nr:uncharacterized protein HG536_0D00900 [Torulaspora globosa]QLL32568.1 hypothetical protein HG536_0D00900 [Torulaspora globosa]
MRSIKCVVVGDGAVGKTSLLISYTTNTFPKDYIPTVFDNYTTTILLPATQQEESQVYKLNLWDTAGQEEYDRLRPLSYPQTDIFLVCFSVSERSSLKNVVDKWYPEIVQNSSPVGSDGSESRGKYPMFLVGTKADLRDDPDERARLRELNTDFVSSEEIEDAVNRCGFMGYVECSAVTQAGVRDVFEKSVATIVREPERLAREKAKAEAQEAAAAAAAASTAGEEQQQLRHKQERPQQGQKWTGSPAVRADVSGKAASDRHEKSGPKLVTKIKKKSKCVIL